MLFEGLMSELIPNQYVIIIMESKFSHLLFALLVVFNVEIIENEMIWPLSSEYAFKNAF